MSKILCFMDFEYTTSGDKRLDFKDNRIELLSIGAIFVDRDTQEEIEHFYEVVKPAKNTILSEYCAELTKLNQKEIDNARGMKEVVDDFVEVAKKYNDIKYYIWGDFDYVALRKSVRITKYKGGFRKIINSLKNIQPTISTAIEYKGQVLNTSWGLQKVKMIYGMDESENKHNALYDARDLKDVYYAFLNKNPKNKEFLKEFYEEKESQRKARITKGLEKHNKEINDLWARMEALNCSRVQPVTRGDLRRLVSNVPVEYFGLETIAFHDKTISIVKNKETKTSTVGRKEKGIPRKNAIQYKYSDLYVEVYPKGKKDVETNCMIPVIEIKVYNDKGDLMFTMKTDVVKSTKKLIIGFIESTFLGN